MKKQTLYKGKYIRLVKKGTWEYVERVGSNKAVVIIPILRNPNGIVFLKEFRVPINNYTLSVPAGLVEKDEDVLVAAGRELEEEAGYKAGFLKVVLEAPSSVGLSCERLIYVIADDLTEVSDGGGDENEDITVQDIAMKSIDSRIEDALFMGWDIDIKIYCAIYLAKNYLMHGMKKDL
jgi:ADP-ribose pyrophosphatase